MYIVIDVICYTVYLKIWRNKIDFIELGIKGSGNNGMIFFFMLVLKKILSWKINILSMCKVGYKCLIDIL